MPKVARRHIGQGPESFFRPESEVTAMLMRIGLAFLVVLGLAVSAHGQGGNAMGGFGAAAAVPVTAVRLKGTVAGAARHGGVDHAQWRTVAVDRHEPDRGPCHRHGLARRPRSRNVRSLYRPGRDAAKSGAREGRQGDGLLALARNGANAGRLRRRSGGRGGGPGGGGYGDAGEMPREPLRWSPGPGHGSTSRTSTSAGV